MGFGNGPVGDAHRQMTKCETDRALPREAVGGIEQYRPSLVSPPEAYQSGGAAYIGMP
jgi:hypothetical protein